MRTERPGTACRPQASESDGPAVCPGASVLSNLSGPKFLLREAETNSGNGDVNVGGISWPAVVSKLKLVSFRTTRILFF